MFFNGVDIALMVSIFVILVVVQLDCYHFWWCECADNVFQLSTKFLYHF